MNEADVFNPTREVLGVAQLQLGKNPTYTQHFHCFLSQKLTLRDRLLF